MSSTPSPDIGSSSRYGFQSPNVRSRVQEKEELSGLNDRLASYIDRMRYLEQQNTKLTAEISTSKESNLREVGNVKALYESELAEARKMLDETAKDKALLQLENNKLNSNLEDLRHKLEKESSLRSRAEEELKRVERRLHEKESLIIVISKERKELDKRCKDMEEQIKLLQDEVDLQKVNAEKELIRRVDAENKLQTLKEEADFNSQIHAKEVQELKSSTSSFKYSVEVDGDGNVCDNILCDKLKELREEFEEEAENAKKELEGAYQNKYDDLRTQANRERSHLTRIIEKNTEFKSELDRLRSDYSVLESKYTQLQKQSVELENLRALDRKDFQNQLHERDNNLQELQYKIDDTEKEYATLWGIKVALDMEISAYRKLLEGEEERLKINTPTQQRGTKRGHGYEVVQQSTPQVENAAVGNIEISECDPAGKFIKIQNNSEQDEPLGGWYVQRVLDDKDNQAVEYKFTPKFILKANQHVTLWGHSTGVKHKPPTDLVLKNVDWNSGSNITITSLINPDAEIVAKHQMKFTTVVRDEGGPQRVRKGRRTGNDRDSCVLM